MVVGGRLQEEWFGAVNHLARITPWLHIPARVYAEYGVVLFAVLLLGAWALTRRGGDLKPVAAALWAPIGVLVAVGINQFSSPPLPSHARTPSCLMCWCSSRAARAPRSRATTP